MHLTGTTSIHDYTADVMGGAGVFLSAGSANLSPELTIGRHVRISDKTSSVQGGGIFAAANTTVTGATTRTVRDNVAPSCNNYWQDRVCVLN